MSYHILKPARGAATHSRMNQNEVEAKTPSEIVLSVDTVRDRLVNGFLLGVSIGGLPAILLALPRSLQFGFRPVQYFTHGIYLLFVVFAFFRRRIPYSVRASFLLGAAVLAGLLSLLAWGLIGMYSVYLMAAVFLGVIFLGIKGGVVIAAMIVTAQVGIAFLACRGVIVYEVDFNTFALAPSSWTLSIGHVSVFAVLLILSFGAMERALSHTIESLEGRTHDLERTSSAMREEMEERRRLEDQLLQAQKMEAVGRLAGGVAHDFNNHLMVILNMSELLKTELGGDGSARQSIEMIQEAAERSASLTQQLLAFSRKQVMRPEMVSLDESLFNLEKMLVRLIGEDVQIEFRLEEASWLVFIDPTQIEQVMINLAVNARDAMPRGGMLIIETKNVHVDEGYTDFQGNVKPGDYLRLTVSDTGTGMDSETLSHVFEPFFTTKGRDKGTGLGLAIVYGIIKQAGGAVNVYSEPGTGTTFHVYLPRADEQRKDDGKEGGPAVSLRGTETVLVVEDEELVRKTTERILAENGYRVIVAPSGEEALRRIHEGARTIDLVITDVIMTGMNGKELAVEIERSHPQIKIIYVSGYVDDVIARHGVLEPGVPFLQKPFASEELLRKVRESLAEE